MTLTFESANNVINQMKVLDDIIKNGVTCNRTGGQKDYWIGGSENQAIIDAINKAAKDQARIEMERCKEELNKFIGSK